MIPQPFVKGGTERVFFGPYEYPAGADLIFDFGNPICTSEFNSNRRVYNVGSANVTASLEPYNNPGPFYPELDTAFGGTATFKQQGSSSGSYMEWNWKSTAQQTNVLVYQPSGSQGSFELAFPRPMTSPANSIYNSIDCRSQTLYANIYDSAGTLNPAIFLDTFKLNSGSLNGNNGWNTMVFAANESNLQYQYVNTNSSSFDDAAITRVTSGTQTFKFPQPTTNYGNNAGSRIMAFLQYPKILTPKEIRQINKVFAQRYFT